MLRGQVLAVLIGVVGDESAVRKLETDSGDVALDIGCLEFVVSLIFESDYHIGVSSVAAGFNPDCFGAGLNRISKFCSQCLLYVSLKIAVEIGPAFRKGCVECSLFVGGSLLDVMEKSPVVPDHDIHVAFRVN